jgi:DNA-binding response OmpR family regulator
VKILVAEDDPITLDSLKSCLEQEGFQVLAAADGRAALDHWEKHKPDVLCLDIMMPKVDGYEVCRQVRATDTRVPILFFSAKSEEVDVVVGLELGADDFVRKPFGTHEFLARVRAALRRSRSSKNGNQNGKPRFTMGDLEIFPRELRAERAGVSIDLSPREVKILELLFRHQGEAVTRDELLNECWSIDYFPESRTLDQHIAKLRKRIESDPADPRIVETVRGVGYRYR